MTRLERIFALSVVLVIGTGCSHMSYTRAWEDDTLTANNHSNQLVEGYDLKHQTNEIVLLDRSGIVCGSLMTTTEAVGNAASARREAIEDGKREYEYEYRQHSPAEYSGLDCGGYYRWGKGRDNQLNLKPAENLQEVYPLDSRTSEAGLHVGFTQFMFGQTWLRYGFSFRLGMGSYGFIHEYPNTAFPETLLDNDDSKFFFRFPLRYTNKIYPWWLYGFGIEGYVGLDPIMLAFSKRWSKFYDHFDYGGQVGYALTFEPIAIGAFVGYHRRNISFGDYISQANSWTGTISIDLNYDAF